MTRRQQQDGADTKQPEKNPEEEGSSAKRPQPSTPRERDPEEEGSAGRPER